MEIQTLDTQEKININEVIFDYKYNEALIHQVVITFINNARSGNSAQKTRAEVRGGGKKPWRQKGTGRARAGTIRSPLWRSGGVTFASKKRDYSAKINKKMYRHALRSILSELYRRERLLVVSDFQCDSAKTKDFVKKMNELKLNNALIILQEVHEQEYLGSRNLVNYEVRDVQEIDPVSLLKFEQILITTSALQQLQEQLQ